MVCVGDKIDLCRNVWTPVLAVGGAQLTGAFGLPGVMALWGGGGGGVCSRFRVRDADTPGPVRGARTAHRAAGAPVAGLALARPVARSAIEARPVAGARAVRAGVVQSDGARRAARRAPEIDVAEARGAGPAEPVAGAVEARLQETGAGVLAGTAAVPVVAGALAHIALAVAAADLAGLHEPRARRAAVRAVPAVLAAAQTRAPRAVAAVAVAAAGRRGAAGAHLRGHTWVGLGTGNRMRLQWAGSPRNFELRGTRRGDAVVLPALTRKLPHRERPTRKGTQGTRSVMARRRRGGGGGLSIKAVEVCRCASVFAEKGVCHRG